MKLLKHALTAVVAASFVGNLAVAAVNEDELSAIQDFILSKRAATVKDIDGDLSIGGEVKTEWKNYSEKLNGTKQVGPGAGTSGVAVDKYTIQADLFVGYKNENTEVFINPRFKNTMGTDSKVADTTGAGTSNSIELRRAYVGYKVMEEDASLFRIDLGRQLLKDVFTSEVQFDNRFDGVLFKYSNSFNNGQNGASTNNYFNSYYANVGAMVVNSLQSHYALAGELGVNDIYNTGLYGKYSLISWRKRGSSKLGTAAVHNASAYRFTNSQLTVGYKFDPEVAGAAMEIFGAGIINHAASKNVVNNGGTSVAFPSKQNKAFYVGIKYGDLKKKGDWSLKFDYQHVGAQAIPDFDVRGIGRTATDNATIYSSSTAAGARGNGNYKGFEFEAAYQLTENLALKGAFKQSKELRTSIGGRNDFRKVEVGAVYAF